MRWLVPPDEDSRVEIPELCVFANGEFDNVFDIRSDEHLRQNYVQ